MVQKEMGNQGHTSAHSATVSTDRHGENSVGLRSAEDCTRISLYIYIYTYIIYIAFIGIYTLCLEKGNRIIYKESLFFFFSEGFSSSW